MRHIHLQVSKPNNAGIMKRVTNTLNSKEHGSISEEGVKLTRFEARVAL